MKILIIHLHANLYLLHTMHIQTLVSLCTEHSIALLQYPVTAYLGDIVE